MKGWTKKLRRGPGGGSGADGEGAEVGTKLALGRRCTDAEWQSPAQTGDQSLHGLFVLYPTDEFDAGSTPEVE